MTKSPSTYAVLTTEGYFRELGLKFSQEEIARILQENEAFYKKILAPFCENTINQHILDYCESLDTYCQQEIQNIYSAYRDYCRRNERKPEDSDPVISAINDVKDNLSSLLFRKNKLENEQKQIHEDILQTAKQLIEEWQSLQAQIAEELTQALKTNDYSLPDNFQEKLQEQLTKQALEQKELPEEALKKLKIKKRAPTLLERALINTLYEGSDNERT
jgi:hypothetical protein